MVCLGMKAGMLFEMKLGGVAMQQAYFGALGWD
jgi:hypothetical protein